MNRLIIGVIFLFSTFSCFGQDDEEEYPSREQIRYYKKARYKEFKPESISVIRQIRYDYVNIRTLDTDNKFVSVRQRTNYQKYYDSLSNIYLVKWREIRDPKYSQYADSVRHLSYSKKIGDIPYHSVLRYDSIDAIKIILYKDSELEEREFGYWIAISNDKGITWKKYYTGFVENYFYFFKPNAKIKFIKNESAIQVEFALVRKTKPGHLPSGLAEYELIEDNLVMELDLAKITLDKDKDGLTDLLEQKFFTNPFQKDSDGDGIIDSEDRNPRYKDIENKYSILFKFILEYSSMDTTFVSFNNFKFTMPKEFELLEFDRTYLIVTDDSNLVNLTKTRNRYIFMTTKEFKEYKKHNYGPLKELGVSPLFDIDNKPGFKKIHINGGFWGNDFLIMEKVDGWFVQGIGGYII